MLKNPNLINMMYEINTLAFAFLRAFHDLYCENQIDHQGRNEKLSEMNILAFVL